jgi:hypothetical protein
MEKNKTFQYRVLTWAGLMACAVLVTSTIRQNFSDGFSCGGGYGVGFPLSFLCDYGSGGSPIDGWGRIDLSDFPYFSLQGLVLDFFFYFVIFVCVAWLIRALVYPADANPMDYSKWMILLSIAFIVGSLFSSFLLEPNRINYHDYILGIPPTPISSHPTVLPSSTPHGTPPSETTPVPTQNP